MVSKKRNTGAKVTASKRIPIKRRELLVLLGIWLAGCVVVTLLLGLFFINSSPQTPNLPKPAATYDIQFSGEMAKAMYLKALAKAQSWSDDVELVALSARWSNATAKDLGQVNTWNFRFFSPRHMRIYFVVITPKNEVLGRAHFKKVQQSPYLISPTAWEIDSNEATKIWLNSGGGAFLGAYAENQVELGLRQTNQGLVWEVMGISADQSQMYYVPINATTGVVLN